MQTAMPSSGPTESDSRQVACLAWLTETTKVEQRAKGKALALKDSMNHDRARHLKKPRCNIPETSTRILAWREIDRDDCETIRYENELVEWPSKLQASSRLYTYSTY